MTKAQIIEILQKYELKTMGIIVTTHLEEIADAILALPIEMPSDKEIDMWVKNIRLAGITDPEWFSADESFRGGIIFGAKWMKDEIIRRNK